MRRRRDRRLPRSRKEMREGVAPPAHPAAPHFSNFVVHPPHTVPTASFAGTCLYAPYVCSAHRYPHQWCSSCQVRAASLYAQHGCPDMQAALFRAPPCTAHGACCSSGIVYTQTMCPTTVMTCAPSLLQPCPVTACSILPPAATRPAPTGRAANLDGVPSAAVDPPVLDACLPHERP